MAIAQVLEVTIDLERAGLMKKCLTTIKSRLLSYGSNVPSQTFLR